MHISARVDYALRALLLLAERAPSRVTGRTLSEAQGLPRGYAESILTELGKLGYLEGKRGVRGGYRLAAPADQIVLGLVVAALEGPFVTVRDVPPDGLVYRGVARHLAALWEALDDSLHDVLDHVTLADVLVGRVPRATSQRRAASQAPSDDGDRARAEVVAELSR